MADNTPNIPGGPVPPRPSEAPKVQPRKETVRINLPPKPTAGGASSATIKLPTLPAAAAPAPFTPAAAPPPSAAPVPPAAAAPRAPAPPAAGASGARVAGPPTRTTAAPPAPPGAPVKRPVAPAAATAVSGLDKGLAIAAAVAGLAALGSVIYLGFVFSTHPGAM